MDLNAILNTFRNDIGTQFNTALKRKKIINYSQSIGGALTFLYSTTPPPPDMSTEINRFIQLMTNVEHYNSII